MILLDWVLIIIAGRFGIMVPGPGGIPLFLLGFALITFPGKRQLTARVLRGKPVDPRGRGYRWIVGLLALLIPSSLFSFGGYLIGAKGWWPYFTDKFYLSILLAILYICCVISLWTFGIYGVRLINLVLLGVPKGRRKIRPWMRRKGLDLLPPRRRRRLRGRGSG